MNKASGFNRLGRKSSHRRALSRNLVTSLFRHERIETTLAKAKELRRKAEKMITRAKVDSVHNRRLLARELSQKDVLHKLFTDISPRYNKRAGGYTRVYKLGPRNHDAAEMALLELVGEEAVAGRRQKKSREKAGAGEAIAVRQEPVQTEEHPGQETEQASAQEGVALEDGRPSADPAQEPESGHDATEEDAEQSNRPE